MSALDPTSSSLCPPADLRHISRLERDLAKEEAYTAADGPLHQLSLLPGTAPATAQQHRALLEHHFYEALALTPPSIPSPPATSDLSLEQRAKFFAVRHDAAIREWGTWRNDAAPEQIINARCYRGPGAELCREFRNAQTWAEQTVREYLHTSP